MIFMVVYMYHKLYTFYYRLFAFIHHKLHNMFWELVFSPLLHRKGCRAEWKKGNGSQVQYTASERKVVKYRCGN